MAITLGLKVQKEGKETQLPYNRHVGSNTLI